MTNEVDVELQLGTSKPAEESKPASEHSVRLCLGVEDNEIKASLENSASRRYFRVDTKLPLDAEALNKLADLQCRLLKKALMFAHMDAKDINVDQIHRRSVEMAEKSINSPPRRSRLLKCAGSFGWAICGAGIALGVEMFVAENPEMRKVLISSGFMVLGLASGLIANLW